MMIRQPPPHPGVKELFVNSQSRSSQNLCEVCGSGVNQESNVLVKCSTCGLIVHQKCYDIRVAPTESYQCDECVSGNEYIEIWGEYEDDVQKLECLLCPIPRIYLRALKPLVTKQRKLGYCHALCASFVPGAVFHGDRVDVTGSKVDWQGFKAECQICKIQGAGSCVKCSGLDCTVWVHPGCAASVGAEEVGFEVHLQTRKVMCPGHSSFALKFPEQADAFLKIVSPIVNVDESTDFFAAKIKKSGKKKKGGEEGLPTPVNGGGRRSTGGAHSELVIRVPKASKGPAMKADPSIVSQRVSMFMEGMIGTVTKIRRNKYVIQLDDGSEIERKPEEVRLIPYRDPGCCVCKVDDPSLQTILCDGCDVEIHPGCMNPPLTDTEIPEGNFFCGDCLAEQAKAREEALVAAASTASAGQRSRQNGNKRVHVDSAEGNDHAIDDEEEDEVMDEGDEEGGKRKRKSTGGRSGGGAKGGGRKSTGSGAGGAANVIFEVKEESIDFDGIFPELSAEDWQDLFLELSRIQRAELVTLLSRYGSQELAQTLANSNSFSKRLTSILCEKVVNQELPAICAEGFVLAGKDASWPQEEIDALKQLWAVNDLKFDLASLKVQEAEAVAAGFALPNRPWRQESIPLPQTAAALALPTTAATTTMVVGVQSISPDGATTSPSSDLAALQQPLEELPTPLEVARSAAAKCGDSLVSIDLEGLLRSCLELETCNRSGFLNKFAEACEKLRLDCERTFSRARLPSFRARELFRKLEARYRAIRAYEPVSKGEWRKSPYPRRAYDQIEDYEPVDIPGDKAFEERNRVLVKLETSKTPNCDESDECSKLAPYSLKLNGFDTSRPCLSRRVGCRASTIGKDQPLALKRDLVEYDSWGFDGATRRFIDAILELVSGIKAQPVQNAIVEGFLLRCVNNADPAYAWDIHHALDHGLEALKESLFSSTTTEDNNNNVKDSMLLIDNALRFSRSPQYNPNPPAQRELATPLDLLRGIQALRMASRMFELQIRPKGVGVRCQMMQGFKAGTFISRYLGELYAPWRWFERQDGVKLAQNKTGFKPPLPDFYNIMLERHEDDPDGYDVLFVDPIVRGNFASRLCHSCDPNCATVVMAVNGKFVIAVYALRDVDYGEELTFDYASVTEDETEFRAAICLCGSASCRGSFLYYAGTGAFASVIGTHHTFLDRVALLLLSSQAYDPLDDDSQARLRRHGIGESILGDVPLWMRKWIALILQFVEFEKQQLAKELVNHPKFNRANYTEESAKVEAHGVAENRRQNVAITANKLGYFLRNAESTEHPLRVLTEQEAVDFLWNQRGSVAFRAVDAATEINELPPDFLEQLEEFMQLNPRAETLNEAKTLLLQLRDVFWSCPTNEFYPWCESCGDVLLMHALTDTWFTSTSYKGFKSPTVAIRNVDIGRDASATNSGSSSSNSSSTANANSAATTFECNRGEVVVIRYGKDSSGRVTVEKEEEDNMMTNETQMDIQRIYVFSVPLPGTVPHYVYRSMQSSGDVVSLVPLPDIKRYIFRFTFHAFSPSAPSATTTPGASSSSSSDATTGEIQPPFVHPAVVAQQVLALHVLHGAAADGKSGISVYGLIEKQLKKCKFVGATTTAAAAPAKGTTSNGDEETTQVMKRNAQAMKVIFNEPKKYQSGFMWGQMVGWFKQTVSDPSASLSAERRGSLSLPDIETCFKENDIVKFNKSRKDMLKKIKEKPDGMWPVGWPYSFKNKEKIYGSPWFDDALDTAKAGDYVKRNDRANLFLQLVNEHITKMEQGLAAMAAPQETSQQ